MIRKIHRRRNMAPTVKMKRADFSIEELEKRILENIDVANSKINSAKNYAKILASRMLEDETTRINQFINMSDEVISDMEDMYEIIQLGS